MIEHPVQTLDEVLAEYVDKPCTKELAQQIVESILEWVRKNDVPMQKRFYITEKQLVNLQVVVWGATFVWEGEPEQFNQLIDAIKHQEI